MPTLRTRVFIIISVAALLVLGVSLILVVRSRRPAPAAILSVTGTPAKVIDSNNFEAEKIIGALAPESTVGVTVKPPTTEEVQKNAARQAAKIFYERYGTYSTDNSFQNIRDVETLVTPAFWNKLSPSIRQSAPAANFSALTTKVISAVLEDWRGNGATAALSVVRTEIKNNTETTSQVQVKVEVVKAGEQWLVDGFTVQK